jgi:molybdate transport system ATP-binding protein
MNHTNQPLISIQDITLKIDSQAVFEHTSWDIQQQESWAILGPTGSGKTLLARALTHSLPLLQGQITYFFDPLLHPQGRPYLNRKEILVLSPETHRDFVKQFAAYHQARWQSFEGEDAPTVSHLLSAKSIEHRSPFETTPFSIDETFYEQKRRQVVDLFKLDYLLDRKIIHLSHGESRKVLIARLLMQSPRLLILDDPFTGLDQESRVILSQGIDVLLKQGNPQILLISSRMEEIPAAIDHLLVVNDLQIVARGRREEILARPDLQPFWSPSSDQSPKVFEKSAAFDHMVQVYASAFAANPAPLEGDVIRMEHISIRYGETSVLQEVNWQVQTGERWVLRGHNGAGKSTLLSLIVADNPQAYANRIVLFGQPRGSGESIWEVKQNMGWVSPELHIYYHQDATSLDVVCSGFFDSVGLYQSCSTHQQDNALGWMGAFAIDTLAHTPFHTLSTGQQRLCLLARAMVKNPPLLILDEPCQGLDDDHRAYFIALLNQLCAHTPITLIYVTHYQDEIPAAMTHQLVLSQGRIQHSGPLA